MLVSYVLLSNYLIFCTAPATGSSLYNSLLLCTVASGAGAVVLLGAFSIPLGFNVFISLFALGEFLILAVQPAVAGLQLWPIPPELRPLSCTIYTVGWW